MTGPPHLGSPPGPDWWAGHDGRWHPPEEHPDRTPPHRAARPEDARWRALLIMLAVVAIGLAAAVWWTDGAT